MLTEIRTVTVHAAVLDFMSRLVVAIGDEDHRLEGILREVGSSFEGTRVGFPDEFDFNIELVKLNSICDAVTFSECPNGFAYLIKKPGVSLEDGGCDQFFDLNGILYISYGCELLVSVHMDQGAKLAKVLGYGTII